MIRSVFRFFNTDNLLKDSSLLFVGMAGVQGFNLLFQMVMGRCLKPEEFALLVALLGLFNLFSMPLGVVSSAINRYTSLLLRTGRQGDVRRLVLRWGGWLFAIGLVLSLFCFYFSRSVADFFHLERAAPILIFGVILTGLFCRPVINGALLGMQSFGYWCSGNILGSVVRLLIGTALVVLISPYAGWGLLGHGLGFYAAMLLGGFALFVKLRGSPTSEEPLPQMQGYLFGSFFILLGCSVLMTVDVVLVKRLYPESAADFSYAATLGRLVIFVPQVFMTAMFPKAVSEESGGKKQMELLWKTLLIVLVAAISAALVFSVVAPFFLRMVFAIPEPSANMVIWCRLLSWAMVPVVLLSVMTRFALAQHRLREAACVPVAAFCYIGFSVLIAKSPSTLLWALGVFSTVAFFVEGWLIGLFGLWRKVDG